MHNRKTTKEDSDDKASEIARALLKRKRDAPAPDGTSPNLRPKTKIKQEEMERKMRSADLGADKKEEVNPFTLEFWDTNTLFTVH
ncbi:hypothetical protein F443_16662 [Phytophthora nicotianae P1569]|uniref:Uncharacterized protein n=1 Tax=Phytophthora nicotianae P1569 TaxID=1317065 RepID=V9EH05_PHYNI|nr:hypothetical protein F443_16662 [Phytophthora nicotianae P1569]